MDVDFKTGILGGEREITLPTGKKLQVKIPAGIKSGTKLRLANIGKSTNDTYIEINVLPSPLFKRSDNDIEFDLPLSLSEAILGGEVNIPTIDGPIILNVPKGLTTGSKIRIKGKGVPHKGGRGDQFAVITVVMPSKIDADLDKFFTEWNKTHAYNPREGKGWDK